MAYLLKADSALTDPTLIDLIDCMPDTVEEMVVTGLHPPLYFSALLCQFMQTSEGPLLFPLILPQF